MARISIAVSDEDLALIDAAAEGNRSAFMVQAAVAEVHRVLRLREDAEIEQLCAVSAVRDLTICCEFEEALPL